MQYERQLSPGIIGSIWLGRLACGTEAGRLVTIRRVPLGLLDAEDIERIRLGAGACAHLRSPSIVKLLGVAELDGELISVSEHLAGIRLIDLERCLIESEATIPIGVAIRLILDVVQASITARRSMMNMGVLAPKRVVVSDSALIALFGEVLLTDVGIMSGLLRNPRITTLPAVSAELSPEERTDQQAIAGSPEVFTLGIALWQLLTNRWVDPQRFDAVVVPDASGARSIPPVDSIERIGMPVPEPVVRLLQRATHRDARKRFASLEAMADALGQLPSHLIATTRQLQGFIQQMAPQVLPECDASATWSLQSQLGMSLPPSSRPVTLHPPGPHDWEPPTFAERRLVAPVTSAAPPLLMDTERPFVAVNVPEQSNPSRLRSFAWLFGAALAIGLATVALMRFARHPRSPDIQLAADPNIASQSTKAQDSERASRELQQTAPPPAGNATMTAMDRSGAKPESAADKRDGPALNADMPPKRDTCAAAPTPPNSPYRPHKIAPYRPKGI